MYKNIIRREIGRYKNIPTIFFFLSVKENKIENESKRKNQVSLFFTLSENKEKKKGDKNNEKKLPSQKIDKKKQK